MIKISKDEARLVAAILDYSGNWIWSEARDRDEAKEWATAVGVFQKKLMDHSADKRRDWAKNDWRALLIRISKKYNREKK